MAETKSVAGSSRLSSPTTSTDLLCLNGGGVNRLSVSDLQTAMKNIDNPVVQMAMDGVSIVTYDASGNVRIIRPSKWTSYKNSGYTPVGICLHSGDVQLVVSLTETTRNWSSTALNGGGVVASDRKSALSDWDGKANTEAQAQKPQCADYASGFCASFSCLNPSGYGILAGSWWLPSEAQLSLIYSNLEKINCALSLVGGTLLTDDIYWSSTENTTGYAWSLYFLTGSVFSFSKADHSFSVRPVTELQ